MQKRILNIAEVFIIGLIIIGVFAFYEKTNSVSRFAIKSDVLRVGIDSVIIIVLLFRSFKLIKNFNRDYSELGKPIVLEKVVYGCCLILLLPDLISWYQWYYFSNLYLYILIIYTLPIVLWAIELIERVSIEKNRIRNFGLVILTLIIPIIGYTIYLSQIK